MAYEERGKDEESVEGDEENVEEDEEDDRRMRDEAYIRWRKSVCLILLLRRCVGSMNSPSYSDERTGGMS